MATGDKKEWEEVSACECRNVRAEEESDEPDKENGRRTAEEVSSSESDEVDAEEMTTEDEEELWMRVERDGFPREETVVVETRRFSQRRRYRN